MSWGVLLLWILNFRCRAAVQLEMMQPALLFGISYKNIGFMQMA